MTDMEAPENPAQHVDPPPPETERQPANTGIGPPAAPADRGIGPPALRAAAVLLASVAVNGVVSLAVLLAAGGGFESLDIDWSRPLTAIVGGAGYAAGCAAIVVAWHLLDRRPQRDLGHRGPPLRAVGSLLLGVLIGLAFISAVIGIGAALGGWSVTPEAHVPVKAILIVTPFLLVAVYWEELLFRGYLLQDLGRRSLLVGSILSSCVFGAVHLANPGVWSSGPLLGIAAGATVVVAGLWLAAAFAWSRDLWLPTGMHFAWNWGQGVLFGMPVSGIRMPSLLRGEMRSESAVFGSGFGPESSLIALVIVGAAGIGALAWLVRRGTRVPVVEALASESATRSAPGGQAPG